jgi:hypothetical protein
MKENVMLIGAGDVAAELNLKYANRHGLIAGATGTGKTVTLQVLAEGFSASGVPVFLADVKGDLGGLSQTGEMRESLANRAKEIGLDDYHLEAFPVVFWDVFAKAGHPVRATISEMGPLMLSRLLELNDTQEGVLNVAFRVADDEGLLLLDLADLRAIVRFVGENSRELSLRYGQVSKASVGAIQRRLLVLEQQGAEHLFGEPALQLSDLMRTDVSGRGVINVLAAQELYQQPRLYATFLLWLLSELFEELPEVGDPDKPKLVFFFDEAHLLFEDSPKALVAKVEQVVRLIRSKGVGVYFVTQSPRDVPDDILGQLGNRVQHALRAFTKRDQQAVRAAAETFRTNPNLDTAKAITEMGVGEALVSTLQEKGIPGVVQRCLIRPPSSRLGPISAQERAAVLARSPVGSRYQQSVDRTSAHELLNERAKRRQQVEEIEKSSGRTSSRKSSRQSDDAAGAGRILRDIAGQLGRGLGRELLRGILGSLSGKRYR